MGGERESASAGTGTDDFVVASMIRAKDYANALPTGEHRWEMERRQIGPELETRDRGRDAAPPKGGPTIRCELLRARGESRETREDKPS